MIKNNEYGLALIARGKRRKMFKIGKSLKVLDDLIPECPKVDESFRAISYQGGFSSISFIAMVALKEPILELTVSTLRIGEKQYLVLEQLHKQGKLDKANFVVCGTMKADAKKGYNYYERFINSCQKNNWRQAIVNNHSKIILMRTKDNFYVIETSSNLNENPQIEQFVFENEKELYNFYYELMMELFDR